MSSTVAVRSVDDEGAVPFADFAIGDFSDLVAMSRELSRTGDWVVRTPFGLLVHGYPQVRAILRDPQWISVLAAVSMLDRDGESTMRLSDLMARTQARTPVGAPRNGDFSPRQARPNVLSVEGDDHRRLRRLFAASFTPGAADRLRPFMASHAASLIEPLVTDGGGEVVERFCVPYPVPVICRLLGVDSNDWPLFSRWAETIFGLFDGNTDAVLAKLGDIAQAQAELAAYVSELVAQRRQAPTDDLLSALIAVSDEGDRLSEDELIGMVEALLLAGTDTTRNQLGATLAVLADRPDQYAALRADPSQVPAFVEESLRYIGAVRTAARIATSDIVVDGLTFPAGTTVMLGLHAASLTAGCPAHAAGAHESDDGGNGTSLGDEAAAAASFDPYQFDPFAPREHLHLAFGSGAHHCLGAALARAELQEALRAFVERVERFELRAPVEWKPLSQGIWGPARMELALYPPAAAAASGIARRVPAGTLPPPDMYGANGSTAQLEDTGARGEAGVSAEHDQYLADVAPLRQAIRDSVPPLIARPKFPPLRRLVVTAARVGAALYWGRLVDRRLDHDERRARTYRRLRHAAEKLGPAYIKLAQLIAAGEGVFPDALVDECRRCRDQVPTEPWPTIERITEAELGPIDDRFAEFDTEAVAAASIAQVHNAVLRDGSPVVVKVQRPAIRRRVERDLAVLAWVAPKLVGRIPVAALANPPALVELFAETISEELDFRVEVANLFEVDRALRANMSGRWQLPEPVLDCVTERVIVMSRVEGRPLSDLRHGDLPDDAAAAVFRQMIDALLEGACMAGVFHGDFHAGNVFIDTSADPDASGTAGNGNSQSVDDGRSGDGQVSSTPVVGLVDFGITGRLEGPRRVAFLRYVVGLLTGNLNAQIEGMTDLGAFGPGSSPERIIADLRLDRHAFDPLELDEAEFTAEFRALISGLLAHGARIPKELMLFVKNFAYLSSIISELDPDMDVLAHFERIATSFFARNGIRMATEIGFSPSPSAVDQGTIRQAMGISPKHERVTWRLIRARREDLTARTRPSR